MQSQTEENEFRGKYFGTDGFRGEAGVNLTAEHAFRIGRFLGLPQDGRRVRVLIGKDTRRSCYQLEYALAAGVAASGGGCMPVACRAYARCIVAVQCREV